MKQSSSEKQIRLRKLTKGQVIEEEAYRSQLKRSWARRPGETWEEKLKREQAEDSDE